MTKIQLCTVEDNQKEVAYVLINWILGSFFKAAMQFETLTGVFEIFSSSLAA